MSYLLVAVGLTLLLFGGDILVRGAVTLAQRLSVPPLVIGLTVVAFGTSAPELVVSVEAVLDGVPEIAIGNVVGSNIANVLLVLGVPAVIYPITCGVDSVRRDGSILLAVTTGFVALCHTQILTYWQGLIMVAMLCTYLIWSYFLARNEGDSTADSIVDEIEGIATRPHSLPISFGFILGGLIGLVVGSSMLVNGAVDIARAAGIDEATIGLTLIALGTSMPELATSLVAAIRRHGDVAVGNVIGSNLFNILGIMGIAAMVGPIPVPDAFLEFDLWVMLAAAILLAPFIYRGSEIGRFLGAVLAIGYGVYMLSLFSGVSAVSQQRTAAAWSITDTPAASIQAPAAKLWLEAGEPSSKTHR